MTTHRRPFTATARAAWRSAEANQVYDDDESLPQAMEHDDVYNHKVVTHQTRKEKPMSCGEKLKWLICSKPYQSDPNDPGFQDYMIKNILKELVIYLVFLCLLCVMTFGMTSSSMFYLTDVLKTLFLKQDSSTPGTTFGQLSQQSDWFNYVIGPDGNGGPLLNGLYWETWYNGRNLTENELGYVFYENKLQGGIRIRQVRVKNNSCTVESHFKNIIPDCIAKYSEDIEEKSPYGLKNGSAWTWQAAKGGYYSGLMNSYGPSGYIVDLAPTKAEALAQMQPLFNNLWIDRLTRFVSIDFTLYNPNVNLFCVICLACEFPEMGAMFPTGTFRTVKLIRYASPSDYFVMACEILFVVFIIYYTFQEGIEIAHLKLAYFKNGWNVLDNIVLVISFVCIGFNVYRTLSVQWLLDGLLANPTAYADFSGIAAWQVNFNSVLAIMVFLAWIKIFKYVRFNKTLTQLWQTIGTCGPDLGGFALLFTIFFFAFGILGCQLFGSKLSDFSDLITSIFYLFRIILGDFDFQSIRNANRITGPLFFFCFIFFVFFILLNMFLAIINDTYSDIKNSGEHDKAEFDVAGYVKKGYQNMVEKMNMRRNKIVDIQTSLKKADLNNDGRIEYEELRYTLKKRGYAETEIEAIFAKYDIDGDRALDEDELRKMQADLEGQKDMINEDAERVPRTDFFSHDDSDDDGFDDDSSSGRGSSLGPLSEQWGALQRRIDRIELAMDGIANKLDNVLKHMDTVTSGRDRGSPRTAP